MHPRSPYQYIPDFTLLARDYPDLQPYLTGNALDFQDDAAQRALTQALLHRDFNLTIDLPQNRLCPPVPNRLNYVLWIQDIVRACEEGLGSFWGEEGAGVCGVDIGTGASAIYPLLACSLEPKWQLVATELDYESYKYARANIQKNGLEKRVQVVKVGDEETEMNHTDAHIANDMDEEGVNDRKLTPNQPYYESNTTPPSFNFDHLFRQYEPQNANGYHELPLQRLQQLNPGQDARTRPRIEFTMCNPPFYGSAEEVEASSAIKEGGPLGVCTGAPIEMITPGGEAQFVGRMVRESVGGGITPMGSRDEKLLFEKSLSNEEQPTPSRRDDRELSSSPKKRPFEGPRQNARFGKRRRVSEDGIGERVGSVRWYTSMLGKMSSVVEVVKELGACGISNYAITEFVQGQTRRWAVGWSCGGFRLPDSISRIQNPNPTLHRLMPPRNTLQFPHLNLLNLDLKHLQEVLQAIDGVRVWVQGRSRAVSTDEEEGRYADDAQGIQGDTNPGTSNLRRSLSLFASAAGDTWSRSARRKRNMKMQVRPGSESGFGEPGPERSAGVSNQNTNSYYVGAFTLGVHLPTLAPTPTPTSTLSSFSVQNLASGTTLVPVTTLHDIVPSLSQEGGIDITSSALISSITWAMDGAGGGLEMRWVYGFDRALFESFASHVARKLGSGRGAV